MKEEDTNKTNPSRINALIKAFKYSHLSYINHFFQRVK